MLWIAEGGILDQPHCSAGIWATSSWSTHCIGHTDVFQKGTSRNFKVLGPNFLKEMPFSSGWFSLNSLELVIWSRQHPALEPDIWSCPLPLEMRPVSLVGPHPTTPCYGQAQGDSSTDKKQGPGRHLPRRWDLPPHLCPSGCRPRS